MIMLLTLYIYSHLGFLQRLYGNWLNHLFPRKPAPYMDIVTGLCRVTSHVYANHADWRKSENGGAGVA